MKHTWEPWSCYVLQEWRCYRCKHVVYRHKGDMSRDFDTQVVTVERKDGSHVVSTQEEMGIASCGDVIARKVMES